MNYIFMNNLDEQIKEIEGKINDPYLCFGTASVYTRCTGYYRAVENFNWGKRREYLERVSYNPFETENKEDKKWVEKLLHGENTA
jgi:GH24 family phage-related lysozyme (muramidase)